MNSFNNTNAKILYYHFAPESYWPIPYFSEQMIVISPDLQNVQEIENNSTNKFIKKKILVKSGTTNLEPILEKVSDIFYPDILICWFDNFGNKLTNIKCFDGIKVMLVGDCHHLHRSIEKNVHYALQENFDFVISGDRRLVNIFEDVNPRKNYWFPGLKSQEKLIKPLLNPEKKIVHIGQTSKFHINRNMYLSIIEDSLLPLKYISISKNRVFDVYNQNALTLNISLNGDMNGRWFQVPGAGGVLVANKLCENTGYNKIFSEDEVPTFSSPTEAISILKKFINNSDLRYETALKAHNKYNNTLSRAIVLEEFWNLINSKKIDPLFLTTSFNKLSKIKLKDKNLNWDNLIVYQTIQECIRISSNVKIEIEGWNTNSFTYLNNFENISVEYLGTNQSETIKKKEGIFNTTILITNNQIKRQNGNYDLILHKIKDKDIKIPGYKLIKINHNFSLHKKNCLQFKNLNFKLKLLKPIKPNTTVNYELDFITAQISFNSTFKNMKILIIGGTTQGIRLLKDKYKNCTFYINKDLEDLRFFSKSEQTYDLIIFFDYSNDIEALFKKLKIIYSFMKIGAKLLFHSALFFLGPYGWTNSFSFMENKEKKSSKPWLHLEMTFKAFDKKEFNLENFENELINFLKIKGYENYRSIYYNSKFIEEVIDKTGFNVLSKEVLNINIKCPYQLNYNGFNIDLDSYAISTLVEKFNWFETKSL